MPLPKGLRIFELRMKSALGFCYCLFITCIGYAQYCAPDRYGAEDVLFARSNIQIDTNLEYGQAVDWLGDTVSLLLDVYQPSQSTDTVLQRPVVVYLHGGGFHAGSKSNQKGRYWAENFASRGYVVFSVDYRLGWPFEDSCAADTAQYMRAVYRASQDTRAALRWIVEFSESFRVDTSQIFLLGTSAGSGASMFASYSSEGDLGAYLSEELGPLDGYGNEYNHPFHVAGIITKAAAIDDLEVLSRRDIPHLLFHGTCDLTVPYTNGAIFHCYAPDRFVDVYGSGDIADELERLNRCFTLYRNVGQGHGAVDDDTVIVYGANFMKSLFCGECNQTRLERFSRTNACTNRSGKTFQVEQLYPNPNNGTFFVEIAGPQDQIVDLELYTIQGQLLYSEKRSFLSPVQLWNLNYSQLEAGVYIVKVGYGNRFTVQRVLIYP